MTPGIADLEKFLEDIITEVENARSWAGLPHNTARLTNTIELLLSDNLFSEMQKNHIVDFNDRIYFKGAYLHRITYYGDNTVMVDGKVYKYVPKDANGMPSHSCQMNLKRYNGFRQVDDYCVVCGKIYAVDLFKK